MLLKNLIYKYSPAPHTHKEENTNKIFADKLNWGNEQSKLKNSSQSILYTFSG